MTTACLTIKLGSVGYPVTKVQYLLTKLGYDPGGIDGTFGSLTESAVKAYQTAKSLVVDGIVGPATWTSLGVQNCTICTYLTSSTIAANPELGANVAYLQQKLKALNYYTGTITGTYDSATVSAVNAFETANGLVADGKVGTDTWPLLGVTDCPVTSCTTIQLGSVGFAVTRVQFLLTKLGYTVGGIDGTFGSATDTAVKAYQTDNGLVADGIVGPDEWISLGGFDCTICRYLTPATIAAEPELGANVAYLQQKLKALGYYTGSVTGTYDSATVSAVNAFETANGLVADGKVGTKTWPLLGATDCNVYVRTISIVSGNGTVEIYVNSVLKGTVTTTSPVTIVVDLGDVIRKKAIASTGYKFLKYCTNPIDCSGAVSTIADDQGTITSTSTIYVENGYYFEVSTCQDPACDVQMA